MGDPLLGSTSPRPVCFDLDGTLVVAGSGAAERLWCALDEARQSDPGLPIPELTELEPFLRATGALDLAQVLPEWPVERLQFARSCWEQLDRHARREPGLSEAPGAGALLAELAARGHRLSVATNAPQVAAERVLSALGMRQYIDEVRGLSRQGESDKAGRLRDLFEESPRGFGVMVGDGVGDGDAACRVGLRFAHYLGTGADPSDCPEADLRLYRLQALPEWLESLPGCSQPAGRASGR